MKTLLDLVGLQRELKEILGKPVDVATPNSLHPLIKKNVLSELILLYERQA